MFMVSSAMPVLLRGIRSHLFIFVLFLMILRGGSKKNLLHFVSQSVLLFSSEVSLYIYIYIYIYILLFRSLIYLEFIFVYAVREYSNCISLSFLKKPVRWSP